MEEYKIIKQGLSECVERADSGIDQAVLKEFNPKMEYIKNDYKASSAVCKNPCHSPCGPQPPAPCSPC